MKTKIIIIYLLLLISILGSSCVFKELDKPLGMTNGCPLYGQIIHRSGSPITNAQEAEKLFLEYKPNIDRGHFAPTLQQDNNEIDELIPFTGYTGGKKGVYSDGWVPVPYGWSLSDN